MIAKLLEIRDIATFVPVLAVSMAASSYDVNGNQNYLLRRSGYPAELFEGDPGVMIMLVRIYGGGSQCRDNPYSWGSSRTMRVAHRHIQEHWNTLSDGDVIDVEYILKETTDCKKSERYEGIALK